jgi:hypothetical protein
MKRFVICDWEQRIPEAKDLGFDGLRSSTAEFHTFFEKKPVFASVPAYPYQINWSSTNSGGGSTNRFETSNYAGDMTLKDALLAAKNNGMDCVIEVRFNGYRNNWSTPDIFFNYTRHTVTTSAGASGGATSISVNATTGATPNGAELVFARSGSYTTRAYISNATTGGTTATIQVYDLQTSLNSGDKVAIVRNGVLIETAVVSGYPEPTIESNNRNIVLTVNLVNSTQLNDAVYVFSSAATIITATKATVRKAAGQTSLNVTALSTGLNSGDYAVVADVPTSDEPYGYRSPDPADASAMADGALAIISYALNDPGVLFPAEQLWVEFWNEPDQRVFGASGIPNGYAYGHGFFTSGVKKVVSAQILACKAAFPNVRLVGPSFSYGDDSVMNSVRSENLITTGLNQVSGIDEYWGSVDVLNFHMYSFSQDGTLRSCAKEAHGALSTSQSNARAFTPLINTPWLITECGVRPEYLYNRDVTYNSTAVANNILVCHDVCQSLGAVGWTHYCYVHRDGGTRYTLTASGSHSIGATTINLTAATGVAIPSGTVLFFGTQGSKVTLTSDATSVATSLSVAAITVGISNNDTSYFHTYLGEQAFHMIPYSVGYRNLHIGVDDPEGKNGIFWEFARRFARVPIAENPVPIPDL